MEKTENKIWFTRNKLVCDRIIFHFSFFTLDIRNKLSNNHLMLGYSIKFMSLKYLHMENAITIFYPTEHFLKTILVRRINGRFGFARHKNQHLSKIKKPFCANTLTELRINSIDLY